MKKVAIVVSPNLALFELGCATDLFAVERKDVRNWYQTEVVSFFSSPLSTSGQADIHLNVKQVTKLDSYDMVIIPSWSFSQLSLPNRMKTAILELVNRGGQAISLCSGVFVLAELGLLDNRPATTHWLYTDIFKEKYPHIQYRQDVLYQYDGKIGCSAGSSAAIDLCLEVIRHDFGYEVANQSARRMVMAAHRNGGQSQFVETPIQQKPNQFAATLDWATDRLAHKIDINQMAQKANMSRRTFDRKFRSSMNMSPRQWLIQQRLHLAKRLLEVNNDSIDLVAYNSGFEKPETLRHNFRKYLKLSPTQYRQQFSSSHDNLP
jgi:AraC family transcriptional activator FtrA